MGVGRGVEVGGSSWGCVSVISAIEITFLRFQVNISSQPEFDLPLYFGKVRLLFVERGIKNPFTNTTTSFPYTYYTLIV